MSHVSVRTLVCALALSALAIGGCSSTPEARSIDAWLGADPHFDVVGTINGETLDVSLDATDRAEVWCTREYTVPDVGGPQYADGSLTEIKVDAYITIGGVRRYVELELKKHDYQSDTIGTMTTIVSRSDLMDPAATEMWLEWEWHDEAGTTSFEQAALNGSFTLNEYSGTRDSTGLIIPDDTGRVGGYWNARWSETEELHGSFTVNCGTNDVELVVP